jgi:hypothetical protein
VFWVLSPCSFAGTCQHFGKGSIIKEATEIELHPNKINREAGFFLSSSQKLLIHNLKERKQVLTKNKMSTDGN